MTPSATPAVLPDTDPHAGPVCSPGSGPPCLKVTSHGRTDRGRVREANEDQFLIAVLTKALVVQQTSLGQQEVQFSRPQGHLFLVADGMGGHAGGEQASALAVDTVERFVVNALNWCIRLRATEEDRVLEEFRQALQQADTRLLQEARRHPELSGMGTTVTLAYCLENEAFVAHVGDSRCYLLRGGLLYRLTRDHTLVEEMVQRRMIRPEDVARHPYRHIITNVVGGSDTGVRVEMHKLGLEAGDRLLLCSDGLSGMVPDEEILAVLRDEPDPRAACARLVARANEQGGKDNITVVVARFDGPG